MMLGSCNCMTVGSIPGPGIGRLLFFRIWIRFYILYSSLPFRSQYLFSVVVVARFVLGLFGVRILQSTSSLPHPLRRLFLAAVK